MVAGLSLCGVPALAAGEFLSALAGFLTLVFLHRLLVRLGLRPLSCLAGVVVASFNIYLWRWNGVVMENDDGPVFPDARVLALPRCGPVRRRPSLALVALRAHRCDRRPGDAHPF